MYIFYFKKMWKTIKKYLSIVHPVFFVFYPILYLYSRNVSLVSFSDVVKPLIVSFLILLVLLVVIHFFFRSSERKREISMILLSASLLLFFSYGHIMKTLENILNNTIASHLLIIISFEILLFFVLFLSAKISNKQLFSITKSLNFASCILLIITIFNISAQELQNTKHEANLKKTAKIVENQFPSGQNVQNNKLPDIYYIILDGYARNDVLRETYNYNNEEFLNNLRSRGFFIAKQSKSNYAQSCLSVASSLNFKYINFLEKTLKNSDNRDILAEMTSNNDVMKSLKEYGYEIIQFPLGYFCIGVSPLADVLIDAGLWKTESLFENLLIGTTVFGAFSINDLELGSIAAIKERRSKILNTFKALNELPASDDPVFVDVHMIATHPPYIFDPNGKPVLENDSFKGYRDQLIFTNKKVLETIDKILARSKTPPIIILQADHGSWIFLDPENPENTNMKERFGILNAYYLPYGGDKLLYDSITPVNTFRLIFNYYFGASYEPLEDKSYFSRWSTPYNFIEIENDKIKNNAKK